MTEPTTPSGREILAIHWHEAHSPDAKPDAPCNMRLLLVKAEREAGEAALSQPTGGGRIHVGTHLIADLFNEGDREFHAAADPTTVLALIDRLQRVETQLHQSQIGWKFTQSASFEAYLKRKNDSLPEEERQPHQTIARDWPMVPHV